ncbi:hypothetical protein GCM10027051_24300 [Niabella terrae]
MKKVFKYLALAALILLLGYNSVYIIPYDKLQVLKPAGFDATAYVDSIWQGPLQARIGSAVDLDSLQEGLTRDPERTFETYTHALAIGNYRYALIKTRAKVTATGTDAVLVTLPLNPVVSASLVTEFVYGNTFRDATGLIDLKDFPNTSQLNQVSEAFNQRLREQVIPTFRKDLRVGDRIEIIGAIELNKAHLHFNDLEIIPVTVRKES